LNDAKRTLEMSSLSGGEAVKASQEIISRLEREKASLQDELTQVKTALSHEQEKLKALEVFTNRDIY
jgi:uncharacterized protein (UPF0335 family)